MRPEIGLRAALPLARYVPPGSFIAVIKILWPHVWR
jgi:hypothetical protein